MEEKRTRKTRRRRPMAPWAVWFLKFTQHVILVLGLLCAAALIVTNTVYVEDWGVRRWLDPTADSTEDRMQTYLQLNMRGNMDEVLRLATIRGQLETNGVFDSDKEINISEYYNRKITPNVPNANKTYIKGAVYHLEDLIRWYKAGNLVYMGGDASKGQEKLANNMFLTVDGLRLEEIAATLQEYEALCKQMEQSIHDLGTNYHQYQYLSEKYQEGATSFVYYVDMDNASGDIFTNRKVLSRSSKQALEEYFDGLVCAAMGTTSLQYESTGEYELTRDDVAYYLNAYDYALGDEAVVYVGYDMSLGAEDYYQSLWEAYDHYDAETVYMLISIIGVCVLYYLGVMLYLMCTAGRRVDKDGNEYLELKWLDTIYTEVFVLWCAVLGFGVAMLGCVGYEYFIYNEAGTINAGIAGVIAAAGFAVSILVVESICSLARRCKGGTIWRDSLVNILIFRNIVRLCKWIGGHFHKATAKVQSYVERTGLWEKTWGVIAVEVGFYILVLILLIGFVATEHLLIVIALGGAVICVVVIRSYRRLCRKVERAEIVEKIEGIVAGEDCRVDVDKLSSENAALGRAVNDIGEGIRQAVETSTKDERLKAELLTNVSHDIKTPLTSIINYVDLLKKENIESETAKEYIEVLDNKSQKLKNLIQDLIEVSKISTGNIEYEMVAINFHELIMQAVAEYDDRFNEHCLKVIYNNSAKDALIMADSRRMWRVMENLLSNVYKYALEGTRVYLDVVGEQGNLMLTMKNISAKELNISQDELTERFVRGDVSRTTEGSGLGLAIAQNLVIGQGGSFKIMLDGDLFKVQISFPIL